MILINTQWKGKYGRGTVTRSRICSYFAMYCQSWSHWDPRIHALYYCTPMFLGCGKVEGRNVGNTMHGPCKTLSFSAGPRIARQVHANYTLVADDRKFWMCPEEELSATHKQEISRWCSLNRLATRCCQETKIVQAILRPGSKFHSASPPYNLKFMGLGNILCLTFLMETH